MNYSKIIFSLILAFSFSLIACEEENLCPDNLEWTEGGDGVEFEYWKDTETEKLFKVEIEIVRDFNGKEEVK